MSIPHSKVLTSYSLQQVGDYKTESEPWIEAGPAFSQTVSTLDNAT